MGNTIITISREFASGGRELGGRLAALLGYAYFDSEIVAEIAKKTELSEAYVKQLTDQGAPRGRFPLHFGQSFLGYPGMDMALEVFEAQCQTLREFASNSDCVIIGRGADYILRDLNPIRIFVYSDMETKLSRCSLRNQENLPEKEILRQIKEIEKKRARHYENVTGLSWGDRRNFDFLINTSGKDIKLLASILASYFSQKGN